MKLGNKKSNLRIKSNLFSYKKNKQMQRKKEQLCKIS